MTATSTPVDMVIGIVSQIPQLFDNALKGAYRMMWDLLINFLTHNWLLVLGLLTLFLVLAIIELFLTGRWAMLGRVLYSYTYYGILFLVGLVFGPEIFANDWVALLLLLVYAVSFVWVGVVLNRTGIRRR